MTTGTGGTGRTERTHGLGLEHETAPAYRTDETGWQLLDVHSFNANTKGPWYHINDSNEIVMTIPGHLPKGKPAKIPKGAEHPLGVSITLQFVDPQSLRVEETVFMEMLKTTGFKEQIETGTGRLYLSPEDVGHPTANPPNPLLETTLYISPISC